MDFFANISRYGRDQRLKFGQLAVFDILEITTGSDLDFGAHKNQKIKKKKTGFHPLFWPTESQNLAFNGLDDFANISLSKMNQRLTFCELAVLDLLNTFIGSDLDCGAQKMHKKCKKGQKPH